MHWYDRNGTPRYDADMRTARKEGLLPSVTSIDKVIASPGLESYKLKQMFDAAQLIQRNGESDKDYYQKVKRQADRHSRDAAKLGTVIHHLIERYLSGKPLFFTGQRSDVWKIFSYAKDWIDEHVVDVIAVEEVLVGDTYAGKADCIAILINGEYYIIDWKTTDPAGKLKKDGQPKKGKLFYPSHIRQLAALQACMDTATYGVMNVVVSTNTDIPGVWVKEWTNEEIFKGLCEFSLANELWYSVNNYEVPRETV